MHSFDPTIFLKNTTESLCFLQTLYLTYNIELIYFLEQLEEILDELRLPVSRLVTNKIGFRDDLLPNKKGVRANLTPLNYPIDTRPDS